MALELVCYRIRLSFSHFIKHAKPFEINISLVAPPGPHETRRGFPVYIPDKTKSNQLDCVVNTNVLV